MSQNKYGNLLDKYTGKESNNSNKILNDFQGVRKKKERANMVRFLIMQINFQPYMIRFLMWKMRLEE